MAYVYVLPELGLSKDLMFVYESKTARNLLSIHFGHCLQLK